jgi:hypothetical protein
MDTAIESSLTEIGKLAPVVAQNAAALDAAAAAETAAEAAILQRAIEIARPALRALCSRLRAEHYTSSGQNGLHPTERSSWHEGSYLCLTDAKFAPATESSDGNVGRYVGCDYGVSRDGSYVCVTYSGRWSRWQGAGDTLVTTVESVTAEEMADASDVSEVLTRLADALRRSAEGGAPARAAKALARAAKLTAIAALVG